MAAFAGVLIASVFIWATWRLDRGQHVSQRMSGMMLGLAGIALLTFSLANLLLVGEPAHVLLGCLAVLIIIVGVWRIRRADFGVDRVHHRLARRKWLRRRR